ncbi:hypothetical protein [Endozoicomonas sp. ONNA1]|uniref:hypothetical protein n=1 Tax=Endozoicomonas sp. ONNA1 TaxID=2828740 RepID=UPI00214834EB|nr:hypothetical protein [Endozoicomonas sp. ONNA1]
MMGSKKKKHDSKILALLKRSDKGINTAKNTFTELFRVMLRDLKIGPITWSKNMKSFLDDPRNSIPKGKIRSWTKGNLGRQMAHDRFTIKVFQKALFFLKVEKVQFNLYLKRCGDTTQHSSILTLNDIRHEITSDIIRGSLKAMGNEDPEELMSYDDNDIIGLPKVEGPNYFKSDFTGFDGNKPVTIDDLLEENDKGLQHANDIPTRLWRQAIFDLKINNHRFNQLLDDYLMDPVNRVSLSGKDKTESQALSSDRNNLTKALSKETMTQLTFKRALRFLKVDEAFLEAVLWHRGRRTTHTVEIKLD